MKYANELKVGLAVIVTAAIFYFGLRFFKDIRLFKGTYDLQTLVSEARGLISGNAVRVQGVKVGAVKDVRYDQSVARDCNCPSETEGNSSPMDTCRCRANRYLRTSQPTHWVRLRYAWNGFRSGRSRIPGRAVRNFRKLQSSTEKLYRYIDVL